jgi:hypothetical protein
VARRDLAQTVENRVADVAANDDGPVSGGQNFPGQRGGGRLAVGARDADHGAGAQSKEKVDLARDLDAALSSSIQELGIPQDARARVHGIDAFEDPLVVAAHTQLDAGGQLRDGFGELRLGPAVGQPHALALAREVVGKRDPAARRPDHQGRHEVSRTTPAAASAETSPAPQKESAMRFSDQPWWWNV